MQALGRRYVRYVNAASGRIGTLWEGRYRAAPIDSEAYFLACCPYIEFNPVRAGTVAFDEQRAHAEGARDFVAGQNSTQRRGDNAGDGKVPEKIRQSAAERFRMLRMFENQRALDVRSAVASAGKLEVAGADCAHLFKEL